MYSVQATTVLVPATVAAYFLYEDCGWRSSVGLAIGVAGVFMLGYFADVVYYEMNLSAQQTEMNL